jgi:proline dehydrogenase
METIGKPVASLDKLHKVIKDSIPANGLDFSNTQIAFANKTDNELKKTAFLFRSMNNGTLVKIGSKLAQLSVQLHLPFVESIIKKTIFWQFCGGVTLLDSKERIERLFENKVQSVLDYGVEAKETEEDFNRTMVEIMRAIDFASQNKGIPVVSTKITGMARFHLLERISESDAPTTEELEEFDRVIKRIDSICNKAAQKGIGVYIDSEETWIQPAIDRLANDMMRRYNTSAPIVFNTFQLYSTSRLKYLMDSCDVANREGFILGAKLVRGAYMEKERKRALEKGYPSPIHINKEATDHDYNLALRFCVDNYKSIACCNASHNQASNYLFAQLIDEKGIPRNHPHMMFCQLLGMSDAITFNLANAGFNVSKYMVYGPVRDVLPYLIRRTEENSSVAGEMGRELSFILREVKRRGL